MTSRDRLDVCGEYSGNVRTFLIISSQYYMLPLSHPFPCSICSFMVITSVFSENGRAIVLFGACHGCKLVASLINSTWGYICHTFVASSISLIQRLTAQVIYHPAQKLGAVTIKDWQDVVRGTKVIIPRTNPLPVIAPVTVRPKATVKRRKPKVIRRREAPAPILKAVRLYK